MSYYFGNIRPGYDSSEADDDDNESFDEAELRRVLKRTNELKRKRAGNREGETKKAKTKRGSDDESDNVDADSTGSEDTDDELRTLSFGSLKKAESLLRHDEAVNRREKKGIRTSDDDGDDNNDDDDDSVSEPTPRSKLQNTSLSPSEPPDTSSSEDSDTGFFEEEDEEEARTRSGNKSNQNRKRKHKHAPTEHSSKKRVSTLREIDGLKPSNKLENSGLYKDIRFDRSTGKAEDMAVIRRRYKFLDEYREREIAELEKMLSDKKFTSKLDEDELREMQTRLTSMKSRLQTIKNRDLESKIVKEYEDKINAGNKTRFHLKKSERRKVVQKWKFDHMGAKQREKVMDRKRKRRLGKEFRQFEFHRQRARGPN